MLNINHLLILWQMDGCKENNTPRLVFFCRKPTTNQMDCVGLLTGPISNLGSCSNPIAPILVQRQDQWTQMFILIILLLYYIYRVTFCNEVPLTDYGRENSSIQGRSQGRGGKGGYGQKICFWALYEKTENMLLGSYIKKTFFCVCWGEGQMNRGITIYKSYRVFSKILRGMAPLASSDSS